jgi:hypothetical protein
MWSACGACAGGTQRGIARGRITDMVFLLDSVTLIWHKASNVAEVWARMAG